MVNEKLQRIGKKLNVLNKDIKSISKKGIARNILYWIIGVLVAILSFILGFFVGKTKCPSLYSAGYPFAMALAIPSVLNNKKKSNKIVALLISAMIFLVALKSVPAFGEAILYNVYKR